METKRTQAISTLSTVHRQIHTFQRITLQNNHNNNNSNVQNEKIATDRTLRTHKLLYASNAKHAYESEIKNKQTKGQNKQTNFQLYEIPKKEKNPEIDYANVEIVFVAIRSTLHLVSK